MIVLTIFAIIVLAIFIFRAYRLVQFFKEANTSQTAKERRIAYLNFGIHLFVCLVILFLAGISFYSMWLMDED